MEGETKRIRKGRTDGRYREEQKERDERLREEGGEGEGRERNKKMEKN